MGQAQSNNSAANDDLTDWQGASASTQQQQQQQRPSASPSPSRLNNSVVTTSTSNSFTNAIPPTTATMTATAAVVTSPPQVEPLPAVVISARPMAPLAPPQQPSQPQPQSQSSPPAPQPYLPHAQATLSYLDTLLSKAEATRDVHRQNVALVASQLKTIQEQTRERMEQETRQREEEQQLQTEMRKAEEEEDDSELKRFSKRARRQLIDDTLSMLQEASTTEHPPPPPPELAQAAQKQHDQHDQQQNGMSEELFAIMNPLNLYADISMNLDNETGLIGGGVPSQEESELFVNEVMADLEETHRTEGEFFTADQSSSSLTASTPDGSCSSAATSQVGGENVIPSWSSQLRKMSAKFKANFQKIDALAVLERAHQNGLISLEVMTQYLAFMQMMLEQDDHEALMSQFNAMNVREDNSTQLRVPTAIALASAQIPIYVDDLIPEECGPDDPDGVPRIRFLLRYSTSSDETYQQIQEEKKRRKERGNGSSGGGGGGGRKQKRKQADDDCDGDDSTQDVCDLVSVSIKPNDSNVGPREIGTCSSSSSIATTPNTPAQQVAYRISWVNAAFERTFGYTQLQIRHEFAAIGQRVIYMFCRSDHIAAFHLILTRMKFEGKNEIHMYQVRTTNDGREIYCLVHIRVNSIKGKMMDGCQSIIPLPDEAQKDMPPFQEGVDLHEDVLLYGYKKPN